MSIALLVTLLGVPGAHASALEAPGFVGGPRITPAGLMWLGSSGPMLAASRLNVDGAQSLPLTSPTSRWMVVSTRDGLKAGRFGAVLHRLSPVQRCPPVTIEPPLPGEPPLELASATPALAALAGQQLFTVVDPHCLHRTHLGAAAILRENLSTGAWKLLAPVPAGTISIGASVQHIVLSRVVDQTTTRQGLEQGTLVVTVYDSRTGRAQFHVQAPAQIGDWLSLLTSVDERDDVLVASTHRTPPPAGRDSEAWWANAASPVEHQLSSVATSEVGLSDGTSQAESPPVASASLSDGQIAYVTGGGHEGEKIDLLDLHTGATRTLATFPGEAQALGLDFDGRELAWGQQSTLPEGASGPSPGGGSFFTCEVVSLGEPSLQSMSLAAIPAAGLTVGGPLPAANQPSCTDFES